MLDCPFAKETWAKLHSDLPRIADIAADCISIRLIRQDEVRIASYTALKS
jgi:hypothetical protein